MKTIIAAVDFSKSSVNAAEYAADLALDISAELCLLHVLQIPFIASEAPTTEQVFEEMQDSALGGLNDLKETLNRRTGGKIRISVAVQPGTMGSQLEQFCRLTEPWLVVMGIAGHSMLRNIVGSNTLSAVRHLPYPLIAVPENAKFHPIHKIGVACDLKTFAGELPVEYLNELQQTLGASFDILYVNKENGKEPDAAELKLLMGQLQELDPDFHFVTKDKLEDGMNKLLEDSGVDLLLVIPKEHLFFEFHRSQSRRVVLHCPIPVMSVHEQ